MLPLVFDHDQQMRGAPDVADFSFVVTPGFQTFTAQLVAFFVLSGTAACCACTI